MNKRESLDILGLQNDGTDDEIKRKFRKLAKQSHPDLNKNNINKTDDFIKLKKAYDTLLNDKKVDFLDVSRVHVKQNSSNTFFDHLINEINNFFVIRKYQTTNSQLSTPEPFVDLRNFKDYF